MKAFIGFHLLRNIEKFQQSSRNLQALKSFNLL